jgi:hypothetical protein
MNHRTCFLGLLALVLPPATGNAALLYGITSANTLVSFDSSAPGTVNTIGLVSAPGIVDIDFYPVNGQLYGLNANGDIFRVNTSNAVATLVGSPSTNIASVTDFDFNPAVDRLRIFSSGDRNFRMVPDVQNSNPGTPGAVVTDGQFSNLAAELVGSAYSNSFDGVEASATSLYSIDTTSDSLILHTGGPTFNTLNVVGPLGVSVGSAVGFDILGLDTAFMSNDNALYRVDLTTGAATSLGTVGGSGLVSLAAAPVPEAGSLAFLLPAALCLAYGRRRRTCSLG